LFLSNPDNLAKKLRRQRNSVQIQDKHQAEMSALVGRNNNVSNPALNHEGPAVENEAKPLVSPCTLSKLQGWEISHATTCQSRNENPQLPEKRKLVKG
jgi:hypothetical protein